MRKITKYMYIIVDKRGYGQFDTLSNTQRECIRKVHGVNNASDWKDYQFYYKVRCQRVEVLIEAI